MDSAAARRLAQEVTALGKDPIEGVRIELMKREADCAECLIEGPSGEWVGGGAESASRWGAGVVW